MNPFEDVLVSIVMPVHNGGRHLEETMHSILGQSHSNLQLICVDDGSTDGSVEIVEGMCTIDGRASLVLQQHLWAGAARNCGLAHAAGSYVMFLDADDLFESDMVEKALGRAVLTDSDMVIFGGD